MGNERVAVVSGGVKKASKKDTLRLYACCACGMHLIRLGGAVQRY